MIQKIKQKIKEGFLRDLITETRWIYSYAVRYKRGIFLYILLGIAATVLTLRYAHNGYRMNKTAMK